MNVFLNFFSGASCHHLSAPNEDGVPFSIQVKFKAALPENCHMFMYTQTERVASITASTGINFD